ncbi:MAG: LacI family transcriptional regulator [Eubacteriales bacterium]|nr:LacI family transcriptional regulator [Eubacteriales bacterium]
MENITIKQIAEMAGVSVSAVSIVLNGKKGVSESTRQRILDIIKNKNFTPNVNSRRLILQRSFNILLAIDPDMSPLNNFFYTAVLNSIVERGSELGYNIVLITNTNSFENSRLAYTLSQHNADGIIFLCDIPSELEYSIKQTKTPFVVVDSQRSAPSHPCIRADYKLAAYCATKYLIENGHNKIGFIGMERIQDYYLHSFAGYKAALSEAGLPVSLDWIQSDAYDEMSAKNCIAKILESAERPTAVYCTGDIFAIGAMNYLQDTGYVLPDDFSVCSVDDIALSQYYHPALTTIRIEKSEMGILAVNMLDNLINKIETETIVTVRSDELLIRNSVARIN